MTLRDLFPGDRFVHASDKKKAPDKFQVAGEKCEYNRAAGTATRKCIDDAGNLVDKQCNLEVRKIEAMPPREFEQAPDGKQASLF